MAWFLRKAFRLGPLRLNLSKRGLGASVGVKGLRVGMDAEGKPYLYGGRRGFYFRERLATPAPTHHEASAAPSAPSLPTPAPPGDTHPRARWWLLVLLALLVGIVLGAVLVGVQR